MRKTRITAGLLALLMVLSMLVSALSSCQRTGDPSNDDPGTKPGDTTPGSSTTVDLAGAAEVYYFDDNGSEKLLALYESKAFVLFDVSGNKSGTYETAGENIVLTFSDSKTTTATKKNGVLTMTLNGAEMRFLEKKIYTVTFDANGGSAVAPVTVINGRLVTKPADPTRDGYVFVCWTDGTKPFAFDAQIITANKTLTAKWAEVFEGAAEYTISFDLGYEAQAPAAQKTLGGKLYELPTPTREGYRFVGWYRSAFDDASKLTAAYTDSTVFTESETLFALWEPTVSGGKVNAPRVDVTATGVAWNAVSGGANLYSITITGPEGFATIEREGGQTSLAVDFANAPAGDYVITVVALAGNAENNSDPVVRYYKNKALPRVSEFTVLDGDVLMFRPVTGAQKYYVEIDCGNDDHAHNPYDNVSSTNYCFVNCAMQEGGIKFRVIATADGYADSVSAWFVYDRSLAPVKGMAYNAATGMLTWYNVEKATDYVVEVMVGETPVTFTTNANKFSLKPYAGTFNVSVTPVTKGYNSPEKATIEVVKAEIATPTDVKVLGRVISWAAVEGATGYELKIGASVFPVETNSIDVSSLAAWTMGADYTIAVRATGADTNSLWSDDLTVRYDGMYGAMTYNKNTVTWRPVIGAAMYEIAVNGGAKQVITDGSYSAAVALTEAGENVITVRYKDANGVYSATASITVYAYTVSFDSRGGTGVKDVYVAVGDLVTPAESQKSGFNFVAWYNTPAGAAGNGAEFGDFVFTQGTDMVLYATWGPKTFSVDLNCENAAGEENTVLKGEAVYGQGFKFPVPAKAPNDNLVFGGWYLTPGGTGTQYTDEFGNSKRDWDITEDGAMLYAKWLEVLVYEENGDGTLSVKKGAGISSVTSVTIPEKYNGKSVTQLNSYAFQSCTKLTEIFIPNTVRIIESNAFSSSTKLERVEIYPVEGNNDILYYSVDGVLMHKDEGAGGVIELSFVPPAKTGDFVIPDGVEVLPLKIFSSSKLTTITIPASVISIEKQAFYSCSSLKNVVFAPAAEGVEEKSLAIAAQAFYSCSGLVEITLPVRLQEFPLNMFYTCRALERIHVPAEATYAASIDGVIVNLEKDTILFCPAGRVGSYTIPMGIKAIGEDAFNACTKLTEVIFNNYVTTIGPDAFYGCSALEKVSFPAGDGLGGDVTIGDRAFYNCSKLATLEIESGTKITTIGISAFYNCAKLTNLLIPKTVTSIAKEAFNKCTGLRTVTIEEGGEGLTFGDYVFRDCSALTEFYLPSNVTELMVNVFDGCDRLIGVYVDDANPKYQDIDGVLYNKTEDGTATEILFYPKTRTGEFVIPATVTKIGAGVFDSNKYLETITISKNVVEIGDSAFANCLSLKNVIFEEGGTAPIAFGTNVFSNSIMIETITIPARVTEIPERMFYFDTRNKSTLTTVVMHDAITKIGERAFYNCSSLVIDTLPAGLKEICDYAFYYCDSVTKMPLPEGFETLRQYALYYCSSLTDLTVPSTLVTVEGRALGYTAIKEVTLPYSIREIGPYIFIGSQIEKLNFPAGFPVTEIPAGTFSGCKSLKTFTVPKTVTNIGYYAFQGCTALEEVIFEPGGTADLVIGKPGTTATANGYAFSGCTSLKAINLPARTTEIWQRSFQNCSAATELSFGGADSRLEIIDTYAFYNCKKITSVTIPATVNNRPFVKGDNQDIGVGTYAFSGCAALTSVVFEEPADAATVPEEGLTVGQYAFQNCSSLTSITFPSRLNTAKDKNGKVIAAAIGVNTNTTTASSQINLYNTFAGCAKLTAINVPEGNAFYKSIDGMLCSVDGTEILIVPAGKTGTLTIPGTVTSVADRAAYKCASLTAIIFEEGTEALDIGEYAFYDCDKVTTLVFPVRRVVTPGEGEGAADVVKYNPVTIGNYSFAYMESLQAVEFSASLTSVGTYAFQYAYALETVTFPDYANAQYVDSKTKPLSALGNNMFYNAKKVTSYVIPSTITSIGNYAFYHNDSLTSVVFEDGTSALTFGNYVFEYCLSLETINLPSRLSKVGTYTFAYCSALKNVNFPDDIKVTSFGNYTFYKCTALEEITLPAKVTAVGSSSFSYCENLRVVNLPAKLSSTWTPAIFNYSYAIEEYNAPADATYYKSIDGVLYNKAGTKLLMFPVAKDASNVELPVTLTEIGDYAFRYNESLETITLPASLTKIGQYAFEYCDKLTSITIPANVSTLGNYALRNCESLQTVIFETGSKLKSPGTYLFQNDKALRNVTLAEGLTTLSNYMFSGCTSLETLVIPSTVTSTGTYSLGNCAALKTVVIPQNSELTTLGNSTFYNDAALITVALPAELTSIGTNCFQNTGITEIVIPENVTEIKNYTFSGCSKLENVVISDSVTKIGTYAFKECAALKNLKMSAGVESIGNYAFLDCASLLACELPTTLTTLGTNVFDGCASLAKVNIPLSLDEIPVRTFAECASLTEIVIYGNIKTIGKEAFTGCASLVDLVITSGVEEIGDYAFAYCSSLTEFTIPDSIIEIGDGVVLACTALETITVNGNADFVVENNVLYNADKTVLYFATPAMEGELNVPASLLEIKAGAFSGANLTSVTLPDTLSEIPAYAFAYNKNLTNVTFGKFTEIIGDYAFTETAISSVHIPKTVTKIGDGAYENCELLTSLTFDQTGSERLVIGYYSFRNCEGLTSVVIPKRVRTTTKQSPTSTTTYLPAHGVGNGAFEGCVNLESVTFSSAGPAVSDYYYLTLGDSAFRNCVKLQSISLPEYTRNYSYSASSSGTSTTYAYPIGKYCFEGCVALSNVKFNLLDTYTSAATYFNLQYAMYAFKDCVSLTSFEWPTIVTTIAQGFFEGSGITSITLGDPDAETVMTYSIGTASFKNCKSLESITINGKLSLVNRSAFEGCSALTTFTYDDATTSVINDSAFKGCSALANFELPETITTINARAFEGCTSLKKIVFSEKLATIKVVVSTFSTSEPRDEAAEDGGPFIGWTSDQTICFVGKTEPADNFAEGWDEDCNAKIVWNYVEE